MPNLVLVVNVRIKPGHGAELEPAMLENAARSVEEEGCYRFDVVVSEDDGNSFLFYEVYRDAEALAAHRQTPHFLKYFALMQALGDNVERTAQIYTQLS
jgi:autoinducer 2-degrading protein